MPFVDRNVERTRLAALARDVQAGTPERHLALVGPRRIGKSKIIEDYLARESTPASPVVVALLAMDGASATLQTYLVEMVRAVVAGFSRRAGRAALGAAASLVELVAEAAIRHCQDAYIAQRADRRRLVEAQMQGRADQAHTRPS